MKRSALIIGIIAILAIIGASFAVLNMRNDTYSNEIYIDKNTTDYVNNTIKKIIQENNLTKDTTKLKQYSLTKPQENLSFSKISKIFNVTGTPKTITNGWMVSSELINGRYATLKVDDEGISFFNPSLRGGKTKEFTKEELIKKSLNFIKKFGSNETLKFVNYTTITHERCQVINESENSSKVQRTVIDTSYIIEFRQIINNYTVVGKRGRITLEICNDTIIAYGDKRIYSSSLISSESKTCMSEQNALKATMFSEPFKDTGKPLNMTDIHLSYVVQDDKLIPAYEMLFQQGAMYHLRIVTA